MNAKNREKDLRQKKANDRTTEIASSIASRITFTLAPVMDMNDGTHVCHSRRMRFPHFDFCAVLSVAGCGPRPANAFDSFPRNCHLRALRLVGGGFCYFYLIKCARHVHLRQNIVISIRMQSVGWNAICQSMHVVQSIRIRFLHSANSVRVHSYSLAIMEQVSVHFAIKSPEFWPVHESLAHQQPPGTESIFAVILCDSK